MSTLSADVLFILALSFSFVKHFFQVFSELFSSKPLIQELFKPFSPLDSNFFSLPCVSEFVKHFFHCWSNFFRLRGLAQQKADSLCCLLFVLALPIFPVRLQTSIFGAGELNFRVRDGNGWTLTAINTNLLFFEKKSKQKKLQTTFFSLPFSSTVRYYIHFCSSCQEKNWWPVRESNPCLRRERPPS